MRKKDKLKMNEYKFEPYQKVLGRDEKNGLWRASIFSCYTNRSDYPYRCIGEMFRYCVPFEGNEHLINTNVNPEPEFEPQKGQLVAVSDKPDCGWEVYKYVEYHSNRYWCVVPDEDVDDEDKYISWLYCEPLKKHFDIGE
jgi:hypothetical protein